MNDKVRMAVTLLPVILVPLFNERNRIKDHPDVQKIGNTSSTVYHTVKDKGAGAAHTVKNVSTSTYRTGKSAVSTVSGVISDKRQENAYKKDMKAYQKSIEEEQSLLKDFENEKEKHRKKRLSRKSEMKVPKIMQSHSQMDNDEKSDLMTVGSGHVEADLPDPKIEAEMKSNPDNYGIAKAYDDAAGSRMSLDESDERRLDLSASKPETDPMRAEEMKSNPDNYGIAKAYDDAAGSRMSLDESDEARLNLEDADRASNENDDNQERKNSMPTSINPYIEEKVRKHDHDIDEYENGALFTKHKQALDPRHTTRREAPKAAPDDSLFQKHRSGHEEIITRHGRRTGVQSAMTKSRKQKKLEKKINEHLQKHHG